MTTAFICPAKNPIRPLIISSHASPQSSGKGFTQIRWASVAALRKASAGSVSHAARSHGSELPTFAFSAPFAFRYLVMFGTDGRCMKGIAAASKQKMIRRAQAL